MTEPARHLHLAATPEAPSDPLVGQLLDGRYRVEGVLGSGGMGLVYRARHEVLGKPLALKVLKPEVSLDAEVMARFRREAQAASAVGSPHICDVSDFGSLPDGSTYFVMELLDGPSLTAAMQSDRPLPAARTLRIARQLCDALGAAHSRGIVHRDLKPDNVHLVPRGSEPDFVKVLDFGIAKVAGGADKKLTRAGQVFGTPHYMSPEQCSGREVDHRTDIYALGVMLYEMATGQVPFDSDTLMGVLTKHVYEQPVPPHELAPSAAIGSGLEAIIMKCLAKQPDDRYASMSALAQDLDSLERGATPGAVCEQVDRAYVPPVTAAAPARVQAAPATPERRGSAAMIVAAIGALIVLAAGALGAAYFVMEGAGEGTTTEAPALGDGPGERSPAVEPEPQEDRTPRVEARAEERTQQAAVEPAMVRLETDPPDAVVYDASGALIGNTPLSLPRPTGAATAQYRIAMRGHREQVVVMNAQTQASLTLHLEPERRGHARVRPTDSAARPSDRPTSPQTTTTTTTTTPPSSGEMDGLINPFGDGTPPPRR